MNCSRSAAGITNVGTTRAYVLLEAVGQHRDEVIKTLKHQEGVVAADPVEGPPDVVLVLEARNRRELASVLINALTSVQNMTESVELLPTRMRHRKKSSGRASGAAEGSV